MFLESHTEKWGRTMIKHCGDGSWVTGQLSSVPYRHLPQFGASDKHVYLPGQLRISRDWGTAQLSGARRTQVSVLRCCCGWLWSHWRLLPMTVTARWPLRGFLPLLPSFSPFLYRDYLARHPWLMCNLSLSSRIQKVDSMYAWIHFWPLEGNMLKDIFEKLDRVYTCTWKDMCERWEIRFWRIGLDVFPVTLS